MSTTVDPDLRQMMRDVLRSRDLVERLGQGAEGITLDQALWRELDNLGLTRLTLPEAKGGSGATWPESAALHSEAAAAGVHLPLVETDLLGGWLLQLADLPVDASTRTVAVLDKTGSCPAVAWAGQVDRIVVLARQGSRAVVADLDPRELQLKPLATRSGIPRFAVTSLGTIEGAPVEAAAVDQLQLRGALARAVQSVGAMERILELCVEHTRVRFQFGRPLARFQSVQNLVADVAAEAALARSAVDAAVTDAAETGLGGPSSAFRVAVARSCVGHASTTIVRHAHQVHGAIGTTVEHPLQLFTLPLLDWRNDFGGVAFWDYMLGSVTLSSAEPIWNMATGGVAAAEVRSAFARRCDESGRWSAHG